MGGFCHPGRNPPLNTYSRALGKTAAAALLGLGCLVGPSGATAAEPEVIELKDGHQVTGEVVAEKASALFVDLGFDVVKIPKDQIVNRRKRGEASPAGSAGPVVATDSDPKGFYKITPGKSRPVKELVREFGEGVISVETPGGLGSGFIVNEDGYAVTNNHVIEGETKIAVVLYQNTEGGLVRRRIDNVEIVALNPFVDLALLKIPQQKDVKLKPVSLGNLDDLNAGDGAFAVGNPLGLERSVSQGIISTLNRNFEGLVYLQTDAAINPGNSGGPLFNMKGEVVGVTNMGFRGTDNLGFAIPIPYVKYFLLNREAFAFDKDNPNTGYRYLDPPRRLKPGPPSRSQGAATGSGSGPEAGAAKGDAR
jgi:serine protease Do